MPGVLLKESLLFAWQSLVTNKLRAFLSLLGITIGIFAIILVFTIVDGLERNIRGSLESLGNDVVYVQKWPWIFEPGHPWWKYINRPTPRHDEFEDLRRRCRSAETIAYRIGARRTVKFRGNAVENSVVSGVSHEYYRIRNIVLSDGRYFTRNEAQSGHRVAVIGARIAEALFPSGEAVGQEIRISGLAATVVGVIKKEGESLLGMSYDYQVVIPFVFARQFIDPKAERAEPTIYAKAKSNVAVAEMIAEIRGHMRSIRKLRPKSDDSFAINEPSLLRSGFDIIFDVIGTAGWIIGGFSILVGGFGIANIMFVSVKERTNIIGIQKSLGARNFFILTQFLSESVLLSFTGGVFGLLLTWIITALGKDAVSIDVSLTQGNVVLGITISVLIGVISGFVPAYGASQMDPVEAIRSN